MWLFLSVWTFNFICTLTALSMVWIYEIAAPVSWALVAPSLAFDIWRLAMPDDYAEDGPHHPIWHSPNTPIWIFGGFCFLVFITAPFFRFSCFPTVNAMLEPYFGVAALRSDDAGGACGRRYGNIVFIYFSIFPFIATLVLAHFLYLCKRSVSHVEKHRAFRRNKKANPKKIAPIVSLFMTIFINMCLGYIGFDVAGRQYYIPVDFIIYTQTMFFVTFYMVAHLLTLGCIAFYYAESNDLSIKGSIKF